VFKPRIHIKFSEQTSFKFYRKFADFNEIFFNKLIPIKLENLIFKKIICDPSEANRRSNLRLFFLMCLLELNSVPAINKILSNYF
jgi:hypothetical protein